jgi:hypothetical protein
MFDRIYALAAGAYDGEMNGRAIADGDAAGFVRFYRFVLPLLDATSAAFSVAK